MTVVAIALGTNVGDRFDHLQRAVVRLQEVIQVDAVSDVYETAPMYVVEQAPFLNAAVRGRTDLGPLPLLRALKAIEQTSGRQHRARYGPREIDLDLVLYGSSAYRFTYGGETVLQIPHPRMAERRFVLAPLRNLFPSLAIPTLVDLDDLLRATNDQAETVLAVQDAVLSI